VERTGDGGRSWTPVPVDGAVLRVRATGPASAFAVIRRGPGCDLAFVEGEAGGPWADDPPSLDVAWYLADEGSTAAVHSPVGSRPGPCPDALVDLAPRSGVEAAVLCADGSVHRTLDAAATWAAVGAVPGAVALADAGTEHLVAALGSARCAHGVEVVIAGASQPVACVPAPDAAPGQVALSVAGKAAWLWAGDVVAVSRDGGRTWGAPIRAD
jgi:hypothetical protein